MQSGLQGYKKMVETERNGGRPVNRPRGIDLKERKKQKQRKRDNWYEEGGYSTVLFVPCTPGSILTKRLKEAEARSQEDREWKVKIVEMGGQTLRSQVSRSDPWAGKQCGRENCFPCKQEKGGECRRKNVGYIISCQKCKAEYHGESSRTMFCRGGEHLRALHQQSQDSPLWAHCVTEHNGTIVPFQMKASQFFMDPLTRQVEEAVRIFHCKKTMNRKGEWKKIAVPRMTYTRE